MMEAFALVEDGSDWHSLLPTVLVGLPHRTFKSSWLDQLLTGQSI